MSISIDENKALIKQLEELGLTEKEARVYIALLPRPDTGTSNLIRATGLHGQFVYAALARLEDLGLAKHVVQNGRKKFSAGAPERILSLVEEKKLSAQAVVRQLQTQFGPSHEQSFEIFQGRNAFVAHEFALLEAMPEGAVINILGGGWFEYLNLFGEDMPIYEAKRIAKRVSLRYLSTASRDKSMETMFKIQTEFFDYRILPQPAPGIETDIYEDKIAFHLYGDPVVSFTFTNKDIATSYLRFFEVLWNLSSK
jgi:HTH-type transcriptional regulator, sugar sensing transcriptional regulator